MRQVSFVRPTCFQSGRIAQIIATAGSDGLAVYMALCHGSASHMTGLCHAPVGSLVRDTGLSAEGVEDALSRLAWANEIERDKDNGLILVHGEFGRQVTRGGKGCHFGHKLAAGAYARCDELSFSPLAQALRNVLDAASERQPDHTSGTTRVVPKQKKAKAKGKGANTTDRVSEGVSNGGSKCPPMSDRRPRRLVAGGTT
jgi:hypothetical protein